MGPSATAGGGTRTRVALPQPATLPEGWRLALPAAGRSGGPGGCGKTLLAHYTATSAAHRLCAVE